VLTSSDFNWKEELESGGTKNSKRKRKCWLDCPMFQMRRWLHKRYCWLLSVCIKKYLLHQEDWIKNITPSNMWCYHELVDIWAKKCNQKQLYWKNLD
jgi:hypothetical protein